MSLVCLHSPVSRNHILLYKYCIGLLTQTIFFIFFFHTAIPSAYHDLVLDLLFMTSVAYLPPQPRKAGQSIPFSLSEQTSCQFSFQFCWSSPKLHKHCRRMFICARIYFYSKVETRHKLYLSITKTSVSVVLQNSRFCVRCLHFASMLVHTYY